MATRPQQRSNLRPENVDDNDHGQGQDGRAADRDEGDGIDNELTPEERAQLEAMQSGEAEGRQQAEPEGDDGAEDRDGEDDGDDRSDADDDADGVDDAGDPAQREARAARDQDAGDDRGQQDNGSQQRPAPRTINYGRHQREITKREKRVAELEGLLNTEREKSARLDERTRLVLEAINSRGQQQQAPEKEVDTDPEPNGEEDPIGHLQWQNRKLTQQVQQLTKGRQQEEQQRRAQTEEEREIGEYMAEVEAAAQTEPAVADAFVYLRESRYRELGSIYAGIDVNDPEQTKLLPPARQIQLSRQIQAAFANEQRMVWQAAREAKRPIGQQLLLLARARGFDTGAARQQDDDRGGREQQQERRQERQQQRQPQGRQPVRPDAQREQQAPARRSVSEEIDNIREAVGASRSLSDAGGVPGGAVDMQRLIEMDEDEFTEVLNGMSKNKLDRIMGK